MSALVVTDTAAPGVHLISHRDDRTVIATVKAGREVAEAMAAAAEPLLTLRGAT